MSMPLLKQLKTELTTKVSKNLKTYIGDLNDVKTTGFIYTSSKTTNIPVTGHFFYIATIALNTNNVYQKAIRLIADLNLMYTYERQCVNGTWTEWKKTSNPNITTGIEYETGRTINGKKEYRKIY